MRSMTISLVLSPFLFIKKKVICNSLFLKDEKKKKKTGIFHKLLLSFIEMALLLKGFINVITKLMCSNIVTSLIRYSLK